MNKLYTLVFALFLSFTAWAAPSEGTHVVALFENQSPEVVARFHGIGRIRTWHRFLNGRWGGLSGFSCSPNANQLARLAQDTRVFVVESNVTAQALSQTIPTGVRRIGCQSNTRWINSTTTPIDVDVAVIDTGIDLTHPDLNVWQNVSFAGTANGNDDNGHGSHCAGIIGAQNNGLGVVGVAPGVRLWAVKVLDSAGSGYLSTIISGVDYVTQHAAEIEIASISLGGQGSSASLRLAIQNSVSKGVVYVVAAGNSDFDVYGGDAVLGTFDDFFPASYPEVMTVAALADSDGLPGGIGSNMSYGCDDQLALFSNFAQSVDSSQPVYSPGLAIDVAAPGVNIYSTYKNGSYATMSGTSMACPHVAGAVALYIAANGRATTASGVYAIRQAIVDRATDYNHWGQWSWWADPPKFSIGKPPLVDVSDGAKPTTYPVVTITHPSTGGISSFANNVAISCQATASDATDGDITANIVWKACVNLPFWTKSIGTGGTVSTTITNLGINWVTASVVNSVGHYAESSARIDIHTPTGATPPTVAIASPVDGGTVAAADVQTFTGTATDPVDGTITSRLQWTSSIDDYLGQGGSFTNFLSAGVHTITATATNVAGLSGSHSHSVTVTGTPPSGNHPPVVTITQPYSSTSPQGTPVICAGTASDQEDGDRSAYIVWSDNVAGGLGNGPTVTYTPAVGSHTVTAQVSDTAGALATATRSFSVIATNGPAVPLVVVVTTDKASYSNKMKALITVNVKASGVNVSGAAVTVTVRGASGKTQTKTGLTTASNGNASYYFNVNKGQLGAGTATITGSASKTGFTVGSGTATFTVLP